MALVLSGIGRERSLIATAAAIERYRPDAVVSIGYSGGVLPAVGGGDLVLGEGMVVSLDTDTPRLSNKRRTSRLRPSISTTWYQ